MKLNKMAGITLAMALSFGTMTGVKSYADEGDVWSEYDQAYEDWYINGGKEEHEKAQEEAEKEAVKDAIVADHEDVVKAEEEYNQAYEDWYINGGKEEHEKAQEEAEKEAVKDAIVADHEDVVKAEEEYNQAYEDWYINGGKERHEAEESLKEYRRFPIKKNYDKAYEAITKIGDKAMLEELYEVANNINNATEGLKDELDKIKLPNKENEDVKVPENPPIIKDEEEVIEESEDNKIEDNKIEDNKKPSEDNKTDDNKKPSEDKEREEETSKESKNDKVSEENLIDEVEKPKTEATKSKLMTKDHDNVQTGIAGISGVVGTLISATTAYFATRKRK